MSGYFQYLGPYSISFGFLSHWFFANSVIITASYLLGLPALLALVTIAAVFAVALFVYFVIQAKVL